MVDSLDSESYTTEKTAEEYQKQLYEVIKECCITKVCGVFQIGPRPVQPMGFDIITYDNCMDFCMEKCQDICKKWEKVKDKDEKKKIHKAFLKEMNKKLSKLRQLHMIHADIKPENVLYSNGWKKIVLIDFGLAMFVKEAVNEETETYFMGTPKFAGKEMKKLYQ